MREEEFRPASAAVPTVARLVLASVVRDEVVRCGFTCRTLAKATGMSSATVNRCMTGKRDISEYELGAFGTAFGWNSGTRARAHRLWVTSGAGAGEVNLRDEILMRLQRLAVESVVVAPWVLPSRLRTPGYDAVVRGTHMDVESDRPWRAGQVTTVFLTPQAVTMPPALPAQQRAEQFAHLVGLAGRGDVHLRFLPGQVTGVQGLEPFEVVRLRDDFRFVRLNHHGMTTLLDDPADVKTYRRVLGDLDAVAEPAHLWRSWLREH